MAFKGDNETDKPKNFIDVESDSDEDIFFGIPSQRERKRKLRLANRRTEIYRPGFRLDSSMFNGGDDDDSSDDSLPAFEEDSDRIKSNVCLQYVSRCEIEVGNYEDEIVKKLQDFKLDSESDVKLDHNDDDDDDNEGDLVDLIDKTNDSLEIHRRRSQGRSAEVEGDQTSYEDSLYSEVCKEDTGTTSVFPLQTSGLNESSYGVAVAVAVLTEGRHYEENAVVTENVCDNRSKIDSLFEDSLESKKFTRNESYDDSKGTSVESYDSDVVEDSIGMKDNEFRAENLDNVVPISKILITVTSPLSEATDLSDSLKRDSFEFSDSEITKDSLGDDTVDTGDVEKDVTDAELSHSVLVTEDRKFSVNSNGSKISNSDPQEISSSSFAANDSEASIEDVNNDGVEEGDLEDSFTTSKLLDSLLDANEKKFSVVINDSVITKDNLNDYRVETRDVDNVITSSQLFRSVLEAKENEFSVDANGSEILISNPTEVSGSSLAANDSETSIDDLNGSEITKDGLSEGDIEVKDAEPSNPLIEAKENEVSKRDAIKSSNDGPTENLVSKVNGSSVSKRDLFEDRTTNDENRIECEDYDLLVPSSQPSSPSFIDAESSSLNASLVESKPTLKDWENSNKVCLEADDLAKAVPMTVPSSPLSEILRMIGAANEEKYLNLSDICRDLASSKESSIVKHCESRDFVEIDEIERLVPLNVESEMSKEVFAKTEEFVISEPSSPSFVAEECRSLKLSDLHHDFEVFKVAEVSDRHYVEDYDTKSLEFRSDAKTSVPFSPNSLKLSDLRADYNVNTTESSGIVVDDTIHIDQGCQTSFVAAAPIETPKAMTPSLKVRAGGIETKPVTPKTRWQKMNAQRSVSKLPTPSRVPISVKSKQPITTNPAKDADKFKTPMAAKKLTPKKNAFLLTKDRFKNIRSPIAAYIQDGPLPVIIQNATSQSKNRLRINLQKKLPIKESAESEAAAAQDNTENEPPELSPLPIVSYKGSKPLAVYKKNWDRVTKLHTVRNKKLPIPSPRVPLVTRHAGQHKKLHWADELVSASQGPLSSPNHPTGIAPPILIKSFDTSLADGTNTVDLSIVDVISAGRGKLPS